MVNQVRDVSSLVNESGMSRSAFYKKFTEEFGDISPKRWLDQYFEQRILYASSIPGTSAKELAFKMGFGDESSFTQYCKRHFGKVPSDLVKERGGVLKDI
jgi:AraC-like DNA-binding protein